ncbi:hypothetical protein JOQ06_017788 [Pogonophryne albipinna]|uniref:Uncharacterized protein n=1 Tax=Pogonophryne albipinna TaxID=1090488 RepID=A0AAD6F8X7_9TELE|nr:hypothetical protein JOQ06_017788 [Pogonophryne albipinna]
MVVNNTPKTRAATPLDYRMDSLEHPMLQSQSKGGRRKGRFKGSDGSTSSDTTTNSLVRQFVFIPDGHKSPAPVIIIHQG